MKKWKIFLGLVLVYICIVSIYLLTSIGIDDSDIYLNLRRFIPVALCYVIPGIVFVKFEYKKYFIEIAISILFAVTTPLLTYLSKSSIYPIMHFPYDISSSGYIFIFLVSIKYFEKYLTLSKAYISNIIEFILLSIPAFQIIYYCIYNNPISNNTFLLIFQTNFNETLEFLQSIDIKILGYGILFILCLCFLIIMNKCFKSEMIIKNKYLKYIFFIISILNAFNLGYKLLPQTGVIQLFIGSVDYYVTLGEFNENRAKIYNDIIIKNEKDYKNNTVILVIGESANRDYMNAYGYSEVNNTPWLTKNKENLILFENAYACAWHTVPALEHALTQANYYNNRRFIESATIIDLAKKAGYKTYWFSNQGYVSSVDTPITLIAKTADVSRWNCLDNNKSLYDIELLKYLKYVNKDEKNLVIVHLGGSHAIFKHRYPPEFQKWSGIGNDGIIADYNNSILYTDTILKYIFEYSEKNLNLDAMIYFSDHGTDPIKGRTPDDDQFAGLRIPMFVYFSDRYSSNNESIVKTLNKNRDEFFSNDLVYNLVCSILGIKSNYLDYTEDISSNYYKYDKDSILVGKGSKYAKDDPVL